MIVPFANILQPLISPLESVMVFIHDHIVGGSWGLAIVGLTVVVRVILLPLAIKQVKSMQELQRLAPQMKAVQAKYKDDKQRQQQELMKLYQEHGVNPFASCLPLVAQLPIFIALFYMLRLDLKKHICGPALQHAATLAHQSLNHFAGTSQGVCDKVAHGSAKFLFISDITNKATGGVLVALIVLYIGSQLASSLVMTMTAERNQRIMMLVLPLIFTVVIINFPAGLLVYWITTNLWTILQQFIIKRISGPVPLPVAAPAGAAAASPANGGGGMLGLGRLLRGGAASDGAGDQAPERAERGGRTATPTRERRTTAPPPSPRKKKKRSGRRR
jgi:YidC/Oxa1 family membrane protein insertase